MLGHDPAIPTTCPKCGSYPMITFLRGTVARAARAWYWPFKKRPRWAVICYTCKEIVGYEEKRVVDVLGTKHLSQKEAELAVVRH